MVLWLRVAEVEAALRQATRSATGPLALVSPQVFDNAKSKCIALLIGHSVQFSLCSALILPQSAASGAVEEQLATAQRQHADEIRWRKHVQGLSRHTLVVLVMRTHRDIRGLTSRFETLRIDLCFVFWNFTLVHPGLVSPVRACTMVLHHLNGRCFGGCGC